MAQETPVELSAEQIKARRQRNIAVAVVLFGLVALFFTLTMVKLGGEVFNRSL